MTEKWLLSPWPHSSGSNGEKGYNLCLGKFCFLAPDQDISEKSLNSNHTFYRKLIELPQVIHTPAIFLKPAFPESARCSLLGPKSLSAIQLCCCSVWKKHNSGWGCIPVKLYLWNYLYMLFYSYYIYLYLLYISIHDYILFIDII